MRIKLMHSSGKDAMIVCCDRPEKLSVIFKENNIYQAMPCGGKGTCGKCRVKFLKGTPVATEKEKETLTKDELKQGWRLACQCVVEEDCQIMLAIDESSMDVQMGNVSESEADTDEAGQRFGIAVDLGTTTLAMELVNLVSGQVVSIWSGVNHQRIYGADVMSRIAYADEDPIHLEELKDMIRKDLSDGIRTFQRKVGQDRIRSMVIAGNTTMIHLLKGYDVHGLASAPFKPYTLEPVHSEMDGIEITMLPGMQAFVGGDLTAGVYALDMLKSRGENDDRGQYTACNLLVDLGTNGEMVLTTPKGIFATSVSAGPAFEGGNISYGMPSVAGAIKSVMIVGKFCRVQTIGNQTAQGLCGTGILEAVYELRRNHLMDETGTLIDEYRQIGYPVFKSRGSQVGFGGCIHAAGQPDIRLTQDDIRQVQMAKSAICAGIETLLDAAGVTADQLDHVYLAGGFGFHLDVKKALALGIFPAVLSDRIQAVGNTSLEGARGILLHPEALDGLYDKIRDAQIVSLADSQMFHELYIERMNF